MHFVDSNCDAISKLRSGWVCPNLKRLDILKSNLHLRIRNLCPQSHLNLEFIIQKWCSRLKFKNPRNCGLNVVKTHRTGLCAVARPKCAGTLKASGVQAHFENVQRCAGTFWNCAGTLENVQRQKCACTFWNVCRHIFEMCRHIFKFRKCAGTFPKCAGTFSNFKKCAGTF